MIVITDHNAKDGWSKIVTRCRLPLTGAGVVQRIIMDLAVFDVVDAGLVLRAVAPYLGLDKLRHRTGARFSIEFQGLLA